MAAPDPFGITGPGKMSNSRRLRVVHDIHIVVIAERLGAAFIDLEVQVLRRFPQAVVPALQCVMERLGDGKKIRFAMDQAPVRLHTERL